MGFTNVANHTDKIFIIVRAGTLAVVQRFNTLCWTSDNILAKFETIAGTLIAQYKTNIIKNKKLSEIHDVLLSKLMSGKIDVSNIEL